MWLGSLCYCQADQCRHCFLVLLLCPSSVWKFDEAIFGQIYSCVHHALSQILQTSSAIPWPHKQAVKRSRKVRDVAITLLPFTGTRHNTLPTIPDTQTSDTALVVLIHERRVGVCRVQTIDGRCGGSGKRAIIAISRSLL